MSLTDQQVESFKTDGYLNGIPIANATEADVYRAKFDMLEAQEGREKCQVGLLDRHLDQPFIWEMATNPKILDSIESILGPNFMLLASQFFCKYEQGSNFVAWHQDVTYWGLEPPMAITAWYAVDRSDTENGCMQIIPGTHHAGIQAHGKSDVEGNLLSINQEVGVTPEDEQRAVDLVLNAGEISIHHGMLFHGSRPNQSDRRRCGLVIRYVPTDVKQAAANSMGKFYQAILVRGEDREHNFGDMKAPVFEG